LINLCWIRSNSRKYKGRMDNIQAFSRDNAWFAPGRIPKTPHPKTQAPRGSIAGTPKDRQDRQEFGVMPHSCRKRIHWMAEIALTGPARLRGPRTPRPPPDRGAASKRAVRSGPPTRGEDLPRRPKRAGGDPDGLATLALASAAAARYARTPWRPEDAPRAGCRRSQSYMPGNRAGQRSRSLIHRNVA